MSSVFVCIENPLFVGSIDDFAHFQFASNEQKKPRAAIRLYATFVAVAITHTQTSRSHHFPWFFFFVPIFDSICCLTLLFFIPLIAVKRQPLWRQYFHTRFGGGGSVFRIFESSVTKPIKTTRTTKLFDIIYFVRNWCTHRQIIIQFVAKADGSIIENVEGKKVRQLVFTSIIEFSFSERVEIDWTSK